MIDPVLLASGLSAMEIARRVGCNPCTVIARQRELGIPVRRQGERGPDRQKRRSGSGIPRLVGPFLNAWLDD